MPPLRAQLAATPCPPRSSSVAGAAEGGFGHADVSFTHCGFGHADVPEPESICQICASAFTLGEGEARTLCCGQLLCAKCAGNVLDEDGVFQCPYCRGLVAPPSNVRRQPRRPRGEAFRLAAEEAANRAATIERRRRRREEAPLSTPMSAAVRWWRRVLLPRVDAALQMVFQEDDEHDDYEPQDFTYRDWDVTGALTERLSGPVGTFDSESYDRLDHMDGRVQTSFDNAMGFPDALEGERPRSGGTCTPIGSWVVPEVPMEGTITYDLCAIAVMPMAQRSERQSEPGSYSTRSLPILSESAPGLKHSRVVMGLMNSAAFAASLREPCIHSYRHHRIYCM